MLRTIIAGPRDLNVCHEVIHDAIAESGFPGESMIVAGDASGIDSCAIDYAKEHCIPHAVFPADWQKYGRKAGPIRNGQMARFADLLIVIGREGEKTPGTTDMLKQADSNALPVYIKEVKG